jgi:RimJ/RimL family protein N-acetyltransferase
MIETERLLLRVPSDGDRDQIAAIHGDPQVGDWLAGVLSREESDAIVDYILAQFASRGFSYWAVKQKTDEALVGLVGLLAMAPEFPPAPALEIGWRLSPQYWGHGYASEAARAVAEWGFANTDAPELLAITARTNLRSQAVMRRIGMQAEPWRDFDHPNLAPDHPLRAHVTFALKRPI